MPSEDKKVLRERFSGNYEKYYLVDLFKRRGYVRKRCENCGKHFWTLKPDKTFCDDAPCSIYTFIGNPPTTTKLGYVDAWKKIEAFFEKNGHTIVPRYPVVARWRPDLFFTVASIIDFQRVEEGKVIFELPVNPLVVPQMCLRFNDIATVGWNGKHNTSFCMIGQTALAKEQGYWKDRCIDLDFELVTTEFQIPEEEVSFVEDVWIGHGAFGYSLEYFVRGLELGNAVFTAYEGDTTNYVEMKEKVIDMGAGLERFAWISQGTPTSYDVVFEHVLRRMNEQSTIDYDRDLLLRYSPYSGRMNLDDYPSIADARSAIATEMDVPESRLVERLSPIAALYAVADHTRTLLFAIADGQLPSNVGGGYNLRVIFRRAQSFVQRYGFKLDLDDVVNWHIDSLASMYPELEDHRNDVSEVMRVESSRYLSNLQRVSKLVSSLASSGKQVAPDQVVKLYESDGVTPEQLVEAGAKVSVPEDFYLRVVTKHESQKPEDKGTARFDIGGLPATRALYYEDGALFNFDARVLRTFEGGYVALDQTAFYPRGGGQEPDHGTLAGRTVTEVIKYGGVILHRLDRGRDDSTVPHVGATVHGEVNERRRQRIRRIHTATHIINRASRQVLGPWVWQHSAFKEEDYGRLDITHFARLEEGQVRKIEEVANDIVMKNLPVSIVYLPRNEAEQKYGFRLYQGGVVPSRILRIVDIAGWDVEACGGTHTNTTGEVGYIKIKRTERIQDGVERLEFVAGYSAVEYGQEIDHTLAETASILNGQRENVTKMVASLKAELERAQTKLREMGERVVVQSIDVIASRAREGKHGVRFYLTDGDELDDELLIEQGQRTIKADPNMVYLAVVPRGASVRILAFVGPEAVAKGVSGSEIVRQIAKVVGGAGGGSTSFAQGGGPGVENLEEARTTAIRLLSASIVSTTSQKG